ncbi:MAG: hypothetical protein WBG19_02625 [Thermoplasmata archaeon]
MSLDRICRKGPLRRTFLSTAILSILIVALLASESLLLQTRVHQAPLRVSISNVEAGPSEFSAELRLEATEGSIAAHLALLSGTRVSDIEKVFVFYDPGYSVRFANPTDVIGLGNRLADYLGALTPAISVSFVSASQLPVALTSNPHSALVDFGYGTLPDSVFSHNVTLLKSWLNGGGLLFWAGGPLAYFEGHIIAGGGFQHVDLGWNGQIDLVGYQLEDPIGNPARDSSGPLLSQNETLLGESLGVTYAGTADGANTSELGLHNGTDLGFDSPAGGAESPRTSLAYVPVGSGGVYFFGGAIWGTGFGVVPEADALLSGDMGLLVGIGYRPEIGPTTSSDVSVRYLGQLDVTLVLAGSYSHVVALVTSSVGPAYFFVWSDQIA